MVRLRAVDSSETVSSGRLSRGSFNAVVPSLSGYALQRRAFALVARLFEWRVVRLIDHSRLEHDLVWNRLLANRTYRHFKANAALHEGIVVATTDNVAGFDQIHHFAAGIDAD